MNVSSADPLPNLGANILGSGSSVLPDLNVKQDLAPKEEPSDRKDPSSQVDLNALIGTISAADNAPPTSIAPPPTSSALPNQSTVPPTSANPAEIMHFQSANQDSAPVVPPPDIAQNQKQEPPTLNQSEAMKVEPNQSLPEAMETKEEG